MDGGRRSIYPTAVPSWLVGDRCARVLDLGSGRGAFAELLVEAGHEVFSIDRDAEAVAGLVRRLGTRLAVAGQVEALPYLACHFDVVTSSQTLHRFAPGLALAEIARVLKPGGHLAVAYNTRDDTVPWVRRLIALLRQADPDSAAGDFGLAAVNAVRESPFFDEIEQRSFRNWLPITRGGLLSMVERNASARQLDSARREELLRQVGALYDSSARPPEPLLLPFRAICWRAVPNHSQLAFVEGDFDAVEIKL